MRKNLFAILPGIFLLLVLLCGCCGIRQKHSDTKTALRFHRVFTWGRPVNDDAAKRYAEAGVTDIPVGNQKQSELAIKYGMTPYIATFTAAGPHKQVMTPEEEKFFIYIMGKDLDRKLPQEERMKIIHRRRTESNHRYGGEKEAKLDVLAHRIPCFISDTDFSFSRKKLDMLLKKAGPGIKGMYLDAIGYTNHRGCYCKDCLKNLKNYLRKNNLPDTQANRDIFYRNELINYYNKVIDYIKLRRPDFKIVAHLWPDFQPDPVFGNRLKLDFCGQTVAWYFKWKEEKIARYTRYVVEHARDHYSFSEGIPFLGINSSRQTSLGHKTPQDLEKELQIILNSGGRTLMICTGAVMIENGYFEVFKKYCTLQK